MLPVVCHSSENSLLAGTQKTLETDLTEVLGHDIGKHFPVVICLL